MGPRALVLMTATFALIASEACSDGAVPEDEPLGTASSALTQKLQLPFPPGHTWYICQSYVGYSHKSNRPFVIGWTKASCSAANNDTGGKPITAPAAGKISVMPNTVAGGDFMCLSLTGGGSIVLGHVKPEAGMKLGLAVAAGQMVATVRTSTDPAAQNAGIAHLHYEAFAGDNCYVGTAQPFTGAWRMQCAPDLPYVATPNFYNGTAITACAPDAGPADAGQEASMDATTTVPEDAATREPPPAVTSDPVRAAPRRGDDTEPDGCSVVRRVGAAPGVGASLLALLVLASLAHRRRSERD
jgi:hypothetical protein